MDSAAWDMMRANEENWDARAPVHVASRFYAQDPAYWFSPYEWDDLGPLVDRDLLHLQCHLGVETIELARRGARCTGLDISASSVREARKLAASYGVDVNYVHANVYEAPFAASTFDVIYTAKGSLCYLPDLDVWAQSTSALLRPGGVFYVAEFHPLLNAFGPSPKPGEGLSLVNDYLEGRGPVRVESARTYTDGPELASAHTGYTWAHGIGEVVTALASAGLRVTTVRESSELPWPRWERMVRNERGWFELPPDEPRVPFFFAVRAVKD